MPKAKEFTVTIADKPGALGECLLALSERGVNILAFQSYVEEGESLARLVVDDMSSAKAVLGGLHMIFEETDVAVIRLAHRPWWAHSVVVVETGLLVGHPASPKCWRV